MIPEWTVGDRLRKARDEVELGVKEMASELGVGARTIHRWERANGEVPRRTLLGYSMICGVPVSWLESGVAEEDRSSVTLRYSSGDLRFAA